MRKSPQTIILEIPVRTNESCRLQRGNDFLTNKETKSQTTYYTHTRPPILDVGKSSTQTNTHGWRCALTAPSGRWGDQKDLNPQRQCDFWTDLYNRSQRERAQLEVISYKLHYIPSDTKCIHSIEKPKYIKCLTGDICSEREPSLSRHLS